MAKKEGGLGSDYDGPTRSSSVYAPVKTVSAPAKAAPATPPVGSFDNPIQPAKEPADYGKIRAAEDAKAAADPRP